MTTKTKTIQFDDLMVQMKKYVATNDFRPVLKYVYFDGTHFIATNSHILLRVKHEAVENIPSDIAEGSLYDPVKKEIVEKDWNYSYPETDRLIPDYNSAIHMEDHFSKFEKTIREKVKENKNEYIVSMEIFNAGFILEGSLFAGTIPYHEDDFKLNVMSNFLKKANITIKKLAAGRKEGVYMGVGGALRPIHFYKEDVFDILVLPVRKY